MNRIEIDPGFCKGCGICIDQCPAGVLARGEQRNAKGYLLPEAMAPQDCTGCRSCELLCPDMAITLTLEKRDAKRG